MFRAMEGGSRRRSRSSFGDPLFPTNEMPAVGPGVAVGGDGAGPLLSDAYIMEKLLSMDRRLGMVEKFIDARFCETFRDFTLRGSFLCTDFIGENVFGATAPGGNSNSGGGVGHGDGGQRSRKRRRRDSSSESEHFAAGGNQRPERPNRKQGPRTKSSLGKRQGVSLNQENQRGIGVPVDPLGQPMVEPASFPIGNIDGPHSHLSLSLLPPWELPRPAGLPITNQSRPLTLNIPADPAGGSDLFKVGCTSINGSAPFQPAPISEDYFQPPGPLSPLAPLAGTSADAGFPQTNLCLPPPPDRLPGATKTYDTPEDNSSQVKGPPRPGDPLGLVTPSKAPEKDVTKPVVKPESEGFPDLSNFKDLALAPTTPILRAPPPPGIPSPQPKLPVSTSTTTPTATTVPADAETDIKTPSECDSPRIPPPSTIYVPTTESASASKSPSPPSAFSPPVVVTEKQSQKGNQDANDSETSVIVLSSEDETDKGDSLRPSPPTRRFNGPSLRRPTIKLPLASRRFPYPCPASLKRTCVLPDGQIVLTDKTKPLPPGGKILIRIPPSKLKQTVAKFTERNPTGTTPASLSHAPSPADVRVGEVQGIHEQSKGDNQTEGQGITQEGNVRSGPDADPLQPDPSPIKRQPSIVISMKGNGCVTSTSSVVTSVEPTTVGASFVGTSSSENQVEFVDGTLASTANLSEAGFQPSSVFEIPTKASTEPDLPVPLALPQLLQTTKVEMAKVEPPPGSDVSIGRMESELGEDDMNQSEQSQETRNGLEDHADHEESILPDVPSSDNEVEVGNVELAKPRFYGEETMEIDTEAVNFCDDCQVGFATDQELREHELERHAEPNGADQSNREDILYGSNNGGNHDSTAEAEGRIPDKKFLQMIGYGRKLLVCPYCKGNVKKSSRFYHLMKAGKCTAITPEELQQERDNKGNCSWEEAPLGSYFTEFGDAARNVYEMSLLDDDEVDVNSSENENVKPRRSSIGTTPGTSTKSTTPKSKQQAMGNCNVCGKPMLVRSIPRHLKDTCKGPPSLQDSRPSGSSGGQEESTVVVKPETGGTTSFVPQTMLCRFEDCGYLPQTGEEYQKHLEEHPQEQGLTCEICDKVFFSELNLASHMNSHQI